MTGSCLRSTAQTYRQIKFENKDEEPMNNVSKKNLVSELKTNVVVSDYWKVTGGVSQRRR